MTDISLAAASDVVSACQASREDLEEAFQQVYEIEFGVTVSEAESTTIAALEANLGHPGLVFLFSYEKTRALGLLADPLGILPKWASGQLPTDIGRRHSLAERLAKRIFPQDNLPLTSQSYHHPMLGQLMADSALASELTQIEIRLTEGEVTASLLVVWPAANLSELLRTLDADAVEEPQAPAPSELPPAAAPQNSESVQPNSQSQSFEEGVSNLPSYTRSLLRIQVPVSVVLAESTLSVQRALDIGPGSIIQFRKVYDDTLTLRVGSQEIAEGEAVKVGDKFGIWLTQMTLPGERFWSLGSSNSETTRVK